MSIDRAAMPFIAGAVVVAAGGWLAGWPLVGALGAVGVALFLFFFRDPHRTPPIDPSLVLSPADGRVMHAGDADPAVSPEGDWRQVSIFLSPLDVHVNRTPVGGVVTDVRYRPGRFLAAYRAEAAAENERSEVRVEQAGQSVVFRQIVGLLARRVVCRVEPGATLRAGDRVGVMKFGSRMDVFVPLAATLDTRVGERVRGGETVIARFPRDAKGAAA